MTAIYEYFLFALMLTCVAREVVQPLCAVTRISLELISPAQEHQAWLEHLSNARRQNILGPLRLEQRDQSLCVVGMGQCRPVESVERGVQLITELKDHIARLF